MRRVAALVYALLLLAAGAGQDPAPGPAGQGVRFRAVDVFADSGAERLAAWQIEVVCGAAGAKVVGVEGGEGDYSGAPYYDPAALAGGRIIVAAFTTDEDPPSGRFRVARLHFQEPEGADVAYSVKVMVAAAPGGRPISIQTELVPNGGSR